METLIKWMNRLTTLAYWLMVAMVPLLAIGAVSRILSGSMNRSSGAQFMLIGGTIIGSCMFLFLILKIVTSLLEENLKEGAEKPEEDSEL